MGSIVTYQPPSPASIVAPIKILWGGASIDDGTTDTGSARPSIDQWGEPGGARAVVYAELRRRLGDRVQMIGTRVSGQGFPGNATTAVSGATPDRWQLSEPMTACSAGQTIAQAAAGIATEVATAGIPDIYVYGGGVGDSSTTGAQMLVDLALLLTNFRTAAPGVPVVVIAPPQDPSDATKQDHRNTYKAGIQALLDSRGGRGAGYYYANCYPSGADDTNAAHGSIGSDFDIHGTYRMHTMRAAPVVEIICALHTVSAGRRYPIARARHPVHAEPTVTSATDALLWLSPAEWTAFFVARGITTWSGGAYVAFDVTPWACPTTSGTALGMFSTGGHFSTGLGVSCVGEGAGGTYRRVSAFTSAGVSAQAHGVGMLTNGRKMRVYVFWHPATDPTPQFASAPAISIWGSTPNGVELFGVYTGVSAWSIQKVPAADASWTKIAWGAHTTQDALPASYAKMAFGLGSIPAFDKAGYDCTGAAVADWVDAVTGRGSRLIDFVEREFHYDLPIPSTLATWPGTEATGNSVGEGAGGTALVLDTMSDNQGSTPYASISSPVWRLGPAQPGDWAPPAPVSGAITGTTTVTDGSILSTDVWVLERTTDGGTVGGAPRITKSDGQVVFTYEASDTSHYAYTRVRSNAGEPRP